MRLFELAYACRVYGCLTTYDDQLDRFRKLVAPGLEPGRVEHRAALFEWLNSWGCRQFAKDHHSTTASVSLIRWAESWLERLPPAHAHLTDLSAAEVSVLAKAYGALCIATASHRDLGNGRSTRVTYGPTGAAKTLFVLRPNACPPWDDPIRARLGLGADESAYRAYLVDVARTLRRLSTEAGVPVPALPELVSRPTSSPPKLVDEYNWVVVTRDCPPPTRREVMQWAMWAEMRAD